MKAFFKMFETDLDKTLDPAVYLDCKVPFNRFLGELKQGSEFKKLTKAIQSSSTNPFKYIRILSLCNLLLINSQNYFCFVEQKLKLRVTRDDWLNSKFIEPYYRFLLKCCASKDKYTEVKNCYIRQGEALQALFYSINMLKLLFKVVEKMPFLGRYYKPSQNELVSSAIQIIALQAQRFYGFFKANLSEILINREFYIKNKNDENIMRAVLADELIEINEEMKKLFLDKYFYPLGRSIGVKLFRPEEQTPQFQKVIHSIVSNHEDTERMKKHEQLQKTLFPGSGLVNWNFYQETLMSVPLNFTGKGEEPVYKQLDDIIVSQEEQGDEQQSRAKISLSLEKKEQSQKQTNSGTLQLKGQEL